MIDLRPYCALIVLVGMLSLSPVTAESSATGPRPELSPEQVVRIQIEALGNDLTDAGIDVVFRFASPSNRALTGPLDRFKLMVKSPPYQDMLGHKKAEFGQEVRRDGVALVPVVLTTRGGERAGFMFVLSQQEQGECEGCWMTDSVLIFEAPQAAPWT